MSGRGTGGTSGHGTGHTSGRGTGGVRGRGAATIALRLLATIALALPLTACSTWSDGPAYYWQSAAGHFAVLRQTRPIQALLDDPSVDPALRERLRTVLAIRRFASDGLALPDNGSYTGYAELDRPFVVWNVFATPELSMRLVQWCFPVAGCVSYRGYYDQQAAERFAGRLRAEGHEAVVRGVPAYSTLGWFDDPVLSTFVRYPEGELARLIFHELAHQVLYVKGDSTFNESFATAVEEVGVQRWLAAREASPGGAALRAEYQRFAGRRADFVALLARHRDTLEAAYASPASDQDKRAAKEAIFVRLRTDYEALKRHWGGYAGYDRWFAQPLTNAHLASVATYSALVPAFRALLAREGGDLSAFHAAARRIGEMPKAERERALAALAPPADARNLTARSPDDGN